MAASSFGWTVSSASCGARPAAWIVTWYEPAVRPSTRQAPLASVVTVRVVPDASRTSTVAPASGRSPASVTTRPESAEGGGANV